MSTRQETVRKFLEELPATTGKSIEQWKAEISGNGPPKFRDRVKWMQSAHGLAYRPATFIALQAGAEPVDYTDATGLLDAMYEGKKAALRPVYERVMEMGQDLGPDVREVVCKTFVSLKRKFVFAQIKPTTATRIDLGLALPQSKESARLIATGGFEKGDRITYRIPLASVAEVDGFVGEWMKKAYDLTPAGL